MKNELDKNFELENFRLQLSKCIERDTPTKKFLSTISIHELEKLKHINTQHKKEKGMLFETLFVLNKMREFEDGSKMKKLMDILHRSVTEMNQGQPDFLEVNDSLEIQRIYECKTSASTIRYSRKKGQISHFKSSVAKALSDLERKGKYIKYAGISDELCSLKVKKIKIAKDCQIISVLPAQMNNQDRLSSQKEEGYDETVFVDITLQEIDRIGVVLEEMQL